MRSDNLPLLCRMVRVELKACLDEELPAIKREFVSLHLKNCHECSEEATWLKRLGDDMQDLEKATPHPRLRSRILASLPLPAYRNSPKNAFPTHWNRLAISGVCAVAFMGIAFASALKIQSQADNSTSQVAVKTFSSHKNHPKHESVAPASKNDRADSQVSVFIPNDPLTLEANARVLHEEALEKNRLQAQLKSNQNALNQLEKSLATTDSVSKPTNSPTLKMTVSNRVEAFETLTRWTAANGGYLSSKEAPMKQSLQGVAPSVTATDQITPSARSVFPIISLLTIRITKDRIASLSEVIRKIGISSNSKLSNSHDSASFGPKLSNSILSKHPGSEDQHAARDNNELVTLNIELIEN